MTSLQKNQVLARRSQQTLGSGKDPAKVNKNLTRRWKKLFKKYPPAPKKVNPLRVAGCDGPSEKYPHLTICFRLCGELCAADSRAATGCGQPHFHGAQTT